MKNIYQINDISEYCVIAYLPRKVWWLFIRFFLFLPFTMSEKKFFFIINILKRNEVLHYFLNYWKIFFCSTKLSTSNRSKIAQPLRYVQPAWSCVSLITCVASALSLLYNYGASKATQKLLWQIGWNKTLNLQNCAKITCHPHMKHFSDITNISGIFFEYFSKEKNFICLKANPY